MENLSHELQARLKKLAYKRSVPFCYGCYQEARGGRCFRCGSDDLMLMRPGSGVEFGCEWIVKELIDESLTPVPVDDAFEESLTGCWPETVTVAWLQLDTLTVAKEMDPVSWDIARSEWLSFEESEGHVTTFDGGSTYYHTHDVERFIDDAELDDDLSEHAASVEAGL